MKPSSFPRAQRTLINFGILVIAIAVSVTAIVQSSYFMMGALIGALFLPFLIESPSWLMIVVIGLFGTELTFPSLPSSLSLHSFLAAVLSVWLLVRHLIVRTEVPFRQSQHTVSSVFLFLYLATLVLIMTVRGTGMRYLGSEEWGGGKYFLLFISAAFFWAAPFQRLTERQWKIAFVFLTIGYLLPFVAQWIISASGGQFDIDQYVKSAFSDTPTVQNEDLQTSLVRDYPLAALGTAIGLSALVLLPVRFPYVLLSAALILVAVVFVGMAGYRSHFMILVGTIVMYSFVFRENRSWRRQLFILLLIGVTCWSFLFLITPYLPPIAQRSLSIVPGLGINEVVQESATGTVGWRIDLWQFSLQMSAPYRWLGRGFLFNPEELPVFDYATGHLFMYLRHSYHNGPLSLLIDTGIPGLIFCSGFFIASIVESRRLLGLIPSETVFGRAYRALYAYLIVQVIYFYGLIGDPVSSVSQILFIFTLLKVLIVSHLSGKPTAPAVSAFPPTSTPEKTPS